MNYQSNQNNGLRIGMHLHLPQFEAANQSHPRVFKSKKHKRRHMQKKKEFEGLIAENRYLKDKIEELISCYSQVHARDLGKNENSVAHSACLSEHPCLNVQDHQKVDPDLGGSTEGLDGLGLNDLLGNLLSNEVESPRNCLTNQQNTMAEFLKKFDDDVPSSVDFPDFLIWFDGEHKTIGKYSFPLSLVSTVEKITEVYGDLSAASLMNSNVTGKIYLFFCCTIKEMEILELHHTTEKKLFKWRDAIKDALRINLKVDFAMQHLKKVARAYVGRQVLQTIDGKLNALNRERAEAYEDFKDCLADAKDFYGKSVSSGLFP